MKLTRRVALFNLYASLFCGHAFAQSDWPSGKVVKMIVPFAAGGSTDLIARKIAQSLGEKINTPVVVENKPGAGGTLGSEWVSKQPADGYAILMGTLSTHSIAPSVYAKLPYNPFTDFTPLAMIATIPNVLVVSSSLPVSNLKEFVELSKNSTSNFSFASNGQGTNNHLAMELLKANTGMRATHVPYKGSGPALTDTVAGHITSMMDVVMTSYPYIKSGKLKPLAVTTKERSPMLPNVPTVAESGYPGFEAVVWFGIWAPPKMNPTLAKKISTELSSVINSEGFSRYLTEQGAQPSKLTLNDFGGVIKSDADKWHKVANDAGVKPE